MKKVNIFTMSVCLLIGVLLSTGSLFAQTSITVKGTVKDASGAPIVGAAVMLDGTTDGTITDVDGKYSLTFRPKGEKLPDLVFSSISYVTQNVRIAGRRVIDVILEEDAEQLEEVVVVGYGAMRKSDITGSVTSVKIDEDQAGQSASIDQLLQGKAAGVQVVSNSGAPDAGVNITIRGAGSFSSSTQPLYVVDGVIMNTSGTVDMGSRGGTDSGEVEETNGLIGLSPQDIASMEILKDASATAIYGSQGANGVVLITTKSASQARPSVTFTSGVSIGQLSKKYDLMDAGDYVQFLKLKGIPENSTHFIVYMDLLNEGTYQEVDWQDYSTRTSVTQRYYLTISGRPKNTNYRFSIGYNDNQGIIKQTGYTNLFTRLNLDKTIGRFTIGTKTAISYLQSSMMQGVGGIGQTPNTSLVFSMLMTRPVIRQIETDDEGLEVDDESIPLAGPDRWFRDYESKRSEFRVISSIYGDVKILDWLSFKTTFGIDCRSEERSTFKSNKINSTGTGSHGSVTNINRLNWNWDNLLNANKKLGRHRIMGTLGHSMFCSSSNYMTVQGNNVKQWKAKSASLNSAPYAWQTYTESQNQLLSFFARATYNYDERYVVTGTFRFDGSSKFAGKNKWAPFPSFAAAWRISNEPWFKRFRFHAPWFTSAKLRLGWGMVGNQNIAAYQTIYRYSSSFAATHDNDYHKLVAVSSLNLPTPDLKWETTTQYNVGLDLDFFKGRLVVAADGYYKKTDDLLQQRVLGASAGINNPYVNMGAVSNTGFELVVDAVPVATKGVEWTIGGNFTLNRNKILEIDPSGSGKAVKYVYPGEDPREVDYFAGYKISSSAVNADFLNVFFAGEPMGLFYGLQTNGIVQQGETGVPFADPNSGEIDPEDVRGPGSVNFIDTNKDGKIDADDKVVIGNPHPDFTYGFNTTLSYKGFRLSASFVGSYGNDIYNQQYANLSDMTTQSSNRLREPVFDAWTPENTDAKWPSLSAYRSSDLTLCSDRFVEDGSYIRLANLALSYSIPFKKKDRIVRHLSFTLSGKNLYCWTKYRGYDPDVNVFGNNMLKYGIDNGAYPSARTYMFDVKISF